MDKKRGFYIDNAILGQTNLRFNYAPIYKESYLSINNSSTYFGGIW